MSCYHILNISRKRGTQQDSQRENTVGGSPLGNMNGFQFTCALVLVGGIEHYPKPPQSASAPVIPGLAVLEKKMPLPKMRNCCRTWPIRMALIPAQILLLCSGSHCSLPLWSFLHTACHLYLSSSCSTSSMLPFSPSSLYPSHFTKYSTFLHIFCSTNVQIFLYIVCSCSFSPFKCELLSDGGLISYEPVLCALLVWLTSTLEKKI